MIALRTSGFLDTTSLVFDKFDPALGTLSSIEITLVGRVVGNVSVESRSSVAKTITTIIAANMKLMRPNDSLLIPMSPRTSITDNLGVFDGIEDFGGTSAVNHIGLTDSDTGSFTATPASTDFALFTGLGTITLPFEAMSASEGIGYGDTRFIRRVQTSAQVGVTYTYLEAPLPEIVVPEPSSFALLGIGGGFTLLFGHMRRRSRRKVA